jgi:hypothetical protein
MSQILWATRLPLPTEFVIHYEPATSLNCRGGVTCCRMAEALSDRDEMR